MSTESSDSKLLRQQARDCRESAAKAATPEEKAKFKDMERDLLVMAEVFDE